MATAISGTVYTINISAKEIATAKKLAAHFSISNIEFLYGNSLEILQTLPAKIVNLDVVYIDGNHSYKYAMGEYRLVRPFLEKRPRAAVIFDDAAYVHPDGAKGGGVPRVLALLGIAPLEGDLGQIAVKPFGLFVYDSTTKQLDNLWRESNSNHEQMKQTKAAASRYEKNCKGCGPAFPGALLNPCVSYTA